MPIKYLCSVLLVLSVNMLAAQKTQSDLVGVWEAKVFKDSLGVKGMTATRYELYEDGTGMAYYYDPLAGEIHPDHIMVAFRFNWEFQSSSKQLLFMPDPESGLEKATMTVRKFKRRKSMALWEHNTNMTEYFNWK